ncbi:MAG: carbamate kinase, partial [Planctomycetes bacterium]|nr:carbamate kinase [Planctomycetota bacterium]
CVADTEGAIGYMIQQTLVNGLQKESIKKAVVTILTQVIVDQNDIAFINPTKPIGSFFTVEEAKEIIKEKGWNMVEDSHRGYRRVVASPKPLKIVEDESVKKLLGYGEIVIAAGGGGIPVVLKEDGALEGVDVVVDKDLASGVLALDIKADYLMMLTGVENVFLNYGKSNQVPLDTITAKEAERYMAEEHFPPGSMGPKIQAAINFLKGGGKCVFITSIDKVQETIAGNTGTRIIP